MKAAADPILVAAREIYEADPADFVAVRKRVAAEAAGSDRVRIGRLAKPVVAAAIVNALARAEPDLVASLVEVGDRLRAAEEAGDAESLRELAATRRRAVGAAVSAAARVAGQVHLAFTPATQDAVEATFQAAVLDRGAAVAVASGLLVKPMAPGADAASVVAVPLADLPEVDLGVRTAEPAVEKRSGGAHPDSAERRKARKAADRAQEEAEAASRTLASAEDDLDGVRAERDRVRQRLAELRDEVADLEERDSDVGAELSKAQRARRDASAAERAARTRAAALRRKAQ